MYLFQKNVYSERYLKKITEVLRRRPEACSLSNVFVWPHIFDQGQLSLGTLQGTGAGTQVDSKLCRCSSLLHETVQHLHIAQRPLHAPSTTSTIQETLSMLSQQL